MGELSKLPNIGKAVEEQLILIGINTADELKRTGSKAAWLKIQEIPITWWYKRGLEKFLLVEKVIRKSGYIEFFGIDNERF